MQDRRTTKAVNRALGHYIVAENPIMNDSQRKCEEGDEESRIGNQ